MIRKRIRKRIAVAFLDGDTELGIATDFRAPLVAEHQRRTGYQRPMPTELYPIIEEILREMLVLRRLT